MKFAAFVAVLWCLIPAILTGPVQLANAAEGTEEVPEEFVLVDDDSTTRTLERLASAATCLVAGIEYTHGQQIFRKDPCEYCLCLDGEMFCWWQDCPPVPEGPCKDRRPFSPCANGSPPPTSLPRSTRSSPLPTTVTTEASTTSSEADNSSLSTDGIETSTDITELSTQEQSTTQATVCVVMGKEYKIGEMLPHATGNCVECSCGEGARVTCYPRHCAPPGDDPSMLGPQPHQDNNDVF